MIFLRCSGSDQSVAASEFLSIAQPSGVADGDLLVVGLALPAGVTATPPSEDWTEIATTNSAGQSVAAFYKTALTEPSRWVFTLSASAYVAGGVLVYGGADGFEPVEGYSSATFAAAGPFKIPAYTVADNNEEVIVFLSALTSGTFTAQTGYSRVIHRNPVNTFEAHRRLLTSAQQVASSNITFSSGTKTGSTLVVVLRPSVGTMSVDDAYDRMIATLPAGADNIYDLTATGDYYKYFRVLAGVLKVYAFDLIDIARRELLPQFSRYKLPNWEDLFGLETSKTARHGTLPQRRAQVVSAWRAAAGQGSAEGAIRATVAPLLGYNDPADLEIMEADRTAIKNFHSYGPTDDTSIPPGETRTDIDVNDGGVVAGMGAQLRLVFADSDVSGYTFTLISPDLTEVSWSGVNWQTGPLRLYAKSFAGLPIHGRWQLVINNGGAGFTTNTLLTGSTLFVEGTARGQSTAGAVFHWGVYVDPAHVGESGITLDYGDALKALKKLAFSHTVPRLITSKTPRPGVTSGTYVAIPGRCIPHS